MAEPPSDVPDQETSDPRYERDALRTITIHSDALGGRGDVSVFVPPAGPRQALPLVLLLHGVYGSHWSWFLQGGAHRTAARLIAEGSIRPMALASPSDGLWRDGSAYLDGPDGGFETWVVRDVVAGVRRVVGPGSTDAPLFIAGLSMGGYGALRLGAKHADRFAGVAAHSAITRIEEMASFVREPFPVGGFPADELDVLGWMERNRPALPPLRFDCGTDDPLLAGNRAFHAALLAAGIPHEYAEHPGGHEWPYWEAHLEETLRFFEATLAGRGGARRAPADPEAPPAVS